MFRIFAAVLLLAVGASAGCDETNGQKTLISHCYTKQNGILVDYYKCNCPWATCEKSGNTHECKVTTEAIVIWVIGSLVTCCLIALCIFCCIKHCKCCCYKEEQKPEPQADPYAQQQPVQGYPQQAAYPPQGYPQQPPPQGMPVAKPVDDAV